MDMKNSRTEKLSVVLKVNPVLDEEKRGNYSSYKGANGGISSLNNSNSHLCPQLGHTFGTSFPTKM